MGKPKVLIAKPIPPQVESYLAEHCEVRHWGGIGTPTYEQLIEVVGDAEGLLTTGGSIDAAFLQRAPQLRVVSNISVGYNNFDIEAMKARGVMGTTTAGALDDTVADLILVLMLATARRVTEMDKFVKEGNWKKNDDPALFGLDVHHATLGLIGMGNIGEEVVRRAKFGFQMDVLYHNRSRRPEAEEQFGAVYASLDEVLTRSDFIVVMVPLNAATKHLIGEREFGLMKSTAIFINASRGAVVDETAMIRALQQGEIYGAGLDVFDQEPVQPDNPLLSMPNVVTLPHLGSATQQTRTVMAMTAARNVVAGLYGETPPNLLDEFK